MINKNLKESLPYYVVLGFLLVLNASILAPPFLIFYGFEWAAASLYNIHSSDHQWIYRSQCVFKDVQGQGSNMHLEDCIILGKEAEAKISTLYTKNGDPRYNGIFEEYRQNQIGINKAEKAERNGMIGYKFANDVRDYAIYIPLMLTMIIHPFFFGPEHRKVPHIIWFVLALVPLGLDGTTQLLAGVFNDPGYYWLHGFGLDESTNTIRWITGAIAGIGAGIFVVPMLNSFIAEK